MSVTHAETCAVNNPFAGPEGGGGPCDCRPTPNTGVDTLCERLEAHEGEQFETTMCFNGVRREAAARIRDVTAERDQYRSAIEYVLWKWDNSYNATGGFNDPRTEGMSRLSMHDLRGMMIHLRASLGPMTALARLDELQQEKVK